MDIKFSIIIPTHNRPKLLKENLLSILRQSYKNFEAIVVDDNSSNDNKNKNKQVINNLNDDRIKYFYLKQNVLARKARNYGIKKSSGNWLLYLDDDNLLLDNALEIFVKNINTFNNIKVFTTRYKFYENNKWYEEGNDLSLLKNPFNLWNIDTCCILHHRDCIKKCDVWNENYIVLDDFEFVIRYYLAYQNNYKFINYVCIQKEPDTYASSRIFINDKLECFKRFYYDYNRKYGYELMKMLIISDDANCLNDILPHLFSFFYINIQNKLKKDDLKKYDVVYQYKNGSLLNNINNFCEGHNNVPLNFSYKNNNEWIYIKKNKFVDNYDI
jgi:glycosyltransferase involved in cell wall biosynthesis